MQNPPIPNLDADWERRLAELWHTLDDQPGSSFIAAMEQLTAELPYGHPVALFELGAAFDSTGSPEKAVEYYQAALRSGLSGTRRRRLNVQLASSLRNLGQAQQAVDILRKELAQPADELDQAVAAFLALALADLGREREALAISLGALSTYLPRYNRSVQRYAVKLGTVDPSPAPARS